MHIRHVSAQALVDASSRRVASLSSQWEKHRAPLVEEQRRLKELCSSQEVALSAEQVGW